MSESNPVDRDPPDMGKGAEGKTEGGSNAAHDKARDLTEKALDAFVEGNEDKAGSLVDKARKMDPSGVQEVMDDLEEDKNSDHNVPGGNR